MGADRTRSVARISAATTLVRRQGAGTGGRAAGGCGASRGFPASSFLALTEAEFDEGEPETYFLPLAIASGRDARRVGREVPERIIATWRHRTDRPHCMMAWPIPAPAGPCSRRSNRTVRRQPVSGEIRALRTAAFDRARGPVGTPLEVIPKTTEQSNSVVLFDHRLLMKVFRRIEPGINPDFEIGKFLSEETPFDRIPQTAGTIEYHREGSEPATLAVLQSLVLNQGTGWDHALGELKAFYERVDRPGTSDDPAAAESPGGFLSRGGRPAWPAYRRAASGTGVGCVRPGFRPGAADRGRPVFLAGKHCATSSRGRSKSWKTASARGGSLPRWKPRPGRCWTRRQG